MELQVVTRVISKRITSRTKQFPVPGAVDSVGSISVDVAAKNVVVMNADTNTLLYQKSSTDKIAPASTAK